MFSARRQAASQLRAVVRQQPRRYASHGPNAPPINKHDLGGTIGHGESDKVAAAKDEPIGMAFWLFLGVIPASIAVSFFSSDSAEGKSSAITRYVDSWRGTYTEFWEEKNLLRTKYINQAAEDKNLFYHATGSKTVDLRFPEIFNTGSPWNVPAGRGRSNMDYLVAHYEKLRAETEEKKLAELAKSS